MIVYFSKLRKSWTFEVVGLCIVFVTMQKHTVHVSVWFIVMALKCGMPVRLWQHEFLIKSLCRLSKNLLVFCAFSFL